MKGLLCGFLITGLLAACQPSGQADGTQLTPEQQTYADVSRGCSVMAHSLRVLAAARAQGRLSDGQIEAVTQTIVLAAPICTAVEPAADQRDMLARLNEMLEGMIFTSGMEGAN